MPHSRIATVLLLLSLGISPGNSLAYAKDEAPPESAMPIRPASRYSGVTYPRIDGSTSTQPLGMLIACRRLGVDCGWTTIQHHPFFINQREDDPRGAELRLTPMAHLQPSNLTSGPDADRHKEIATKARGILGLVNHRGTHGSIVQVIKGFSALALTARAPSDDELKMARQWHVELTATPIALDAFVFVRHKDNPIKSLSTKQIRDIYTGKVQSWKDLGGPDRTIHPYQRNKTSGSQVLMEKLVMQGMDMAPGVKPLMAYSMMGVFSMMTQDPDGLAYSVYFFERFMTADTNTALLAVDGIQPSYTTIRDGSYPYATKVYAVARADLPDQHPAHAIRQWLLTPAGQAVIGESGYVPLPTGQRQTGK